eukprot:2083501-Pleurochrysis_carterae.AAC.1
MFGRDTSSAPFRLSVVSPVSCERQPVARPKIRAWPGRHCRRIGCGHQNAQQHTRAPFGYKRQNSGDAQ